MIYGRDNPEAILKFVKAFEANFALTDHTQLKEIED